MISNGAMLAGLPTAEGVGGLRMSKERDLPQIGDAERGSTPICPAHYSLWPMSGQRYFVLPSSQGERAPYVCLGSMLALPDVTLACSSAAGATRSGEIYFALTSGPR